MAPVSCAKKRRPKGLDGSGISRACSDLILTIVTIGVEGAYLAHLKDAGQVTVADGASAVPAGGGSSLLLPGGLGISLPTL